MYLYYSKLDYRKIKKKNIVNKYNLNFSTAIFIVMNHVMQIKLLSHQSCDVIVFIFEKLFIKCFLQQAVSELVDRFIPFVDLFHTTSSILFLFFLLYYHCCFITVRVKRTQYSTRWMICVSS